MSLVQLLPKYNYEKKECDDLAYSYTSTYYLHVENTGVIHLFYISTDTHREAVGTYW